MAGWLHHEHAYRGKRIEPVRSWRIQLVENIWDTVAEVPEEVLLPDEQRAAIDRRLDAYHQNPDERSPWGMMRERIRSRR